MIPAKKPIELLGLPATGKSFYKNQTIRSDNYAASTVGRFSKFYYFGLFLCVHPLISAKLIQLTLRLPSIGDHKKHKILNILIPGLAREARAMFIKNPIIDEGIYQYLFSLYEKEVTIEILHSDFSFLKSLDRRVIFFRAHSREVLEHRMQQRGRTFRSVMTAEDRKKYTKYLHHNEPIFLSFVSSLSKVEVITT